MKRYFSALLVIILVISFAVTAFSFKIDGTVDGFEWENADSAIVFSSGESNNEVEFGSYMWFVDENNLYLYFNFTDPNLLPDNTKAGVSLCIDDSESYTFTSSTYENYDSEKYRVEGAMQIDITQGASCEVRVGFKHGIPDNINGKVRFIDSNGSYSNIYDFKIENKTSDNDYIYEYYEPSTVKPTTTKAEKSTASETVKSDKTTKKNDDDSLGFLDFLFYDETTTQKKTTKSTTRRETPKTTKKPKTSVKIVEKEVYITVIETNAAKSEPVEENTTIKDTTAHAQITSSQGKKYQMITAAGGLAVLLSIAVIGTVGANKKANKEHEKETQKQESEKSSD